MAYITGPFEGFMSTSEAAAIWGKEESTIRKAILNKKFQEGKTCAKFGKQWVVTAEGMREWTGDIAPWSRYRANCRRSESLNGDCSTCKYAKADGTCTHQKSWWEQDKTDDGGCPLWDE